MSTESKHDYYRLVYTQYLRATGEPFQAHIDSVATPFGLICPDFYAFDGYTIIGPRSSLDDLRIRWIVSHAERLEHVPAFWFIPYDVIEEIAAQQLTVYLTQQEESPAVAKLLAQVTKELA